MASNVKELFISLINQTIYRENETFVLTFVNGCYPIQNIIWLFLLTICTCDSGFVILHQSSKISPPYPTIFTTINITSMTTIYNNIARLTAALVTVTVCTLSSFGQNIGGVTSGIVFNNESSDTTRLTSILIDATSGERRQGNSQTYLLGMAEQFIGTPYVASTLEGEPEALRVNLDGMDCTTFVQTAMALAMTAAEGRSSWRDFIYNLESLRYRGGRMNGYGSRLHYTTDWALDNITRGNLIEVTDRVGRTNYMVKSIDWMTRNRDNYPAMQDSTLYAEIKHVEEGYHGHRMGYIKSSNVIGANLQDGDIVALVSRKPGLDISHIGIIKMRKGKPHLLHASSTGKQVRIEEKTLTDYLRPMREVAGIRVFRLAGY